MTRTSWLVAVIVVLGAGRFLPGCGATELVLDDPGIIEGHPAVRENDVLGAFAAPWWWTPPGVPPRPNWRPLTLAGFALQHAIVGRPPPSRLSPLSWRAVNLLCYMGVCWLVWLLARRLCGSDPPALLATVLFAFHPAHVEAVVPIVGRADLWATAGIVAGCVAWLRYRDGGPGAVRWQFAAVAAFAAALLCKESAAPFVLLIPMLDAWVVQPDRRPARRVALGSYLPLAGVVLLWLGARWLVLGASTLHQPGAGAGLSATVLGVGRNTGWSVALFVWPWWTHHIVTTLPSEAPHLYPPMSWSLGGAALLAFAGVTMTGWVALRRRAPVLAFCWAAAVACWLPTSGLVPIGAGVALRFLFLPSVFACIGLALAAETGWRRLSIPPAAGRWTAGVLAAVVGLAMGVHHALQWRDTQTFHESILRQQPECYESLVTAAGGVHQRGDGAAALAMLERARLLAPERVPAYRNLLIVHSWGSGAVQYGPAADLEASAAVIAAWRRVAPESWEPWYELGLLQRRHGAATTARASFAAALQRHPPVGIRSRLEALRDGR